MPFANRLWCWRDPIGTSKDTAERYFIHWLRNQPSSITISQRFRNAKCQYVLGDGLTDNSTYDLVLVIDVVEHVEDCFSFLRQTKLKGRFKLFHIPLDTHISGTLRGLS